MRCGRVRLSIVACTLWLVASAINSFAATEASDDPVPYFPPPTLPDPVIPPSKLINLDSPVRIPGEYMISFKGEDDLKKDIPSVLLNSLKIAPGVLPNTAGNIALLAKAMSAWYQQKEKAANTILGIWTLGARAPIATPQGRLQRRLRVAHGIFTRAFAARYATVSCRRCSSEKLSFASSQTLLSSSLIWCSTSSLKTLASALCCGDMAFCTAANC